MTTLHAVVIALAILGVVLTLVALSKLGERPFTKWHHAFIGLVFSLAPASWGVIAALLWLAGLAIIADDLYQHRRQKREPYFTSYLHRLYERAYRAVHSRIR